MATPYIGCRISLISKTEIRYEGYLASIDGEKQTVTLQNVRTFGSEGRRGGGDQEVEPSNEIFEYVMFRASDIKDLNVSEPPPPQTQQPPILPNDPAILRGVPSYQPGYPPYGSPYHPPPPQGYGMPMGYGYPHNPYGHWGQYPPGMMYAPEHQGPHGLPAGSSSNVAPPGLPATAAPASSSASVGNSSISQAAPTDSKAISSQAVKKSEPEAPSKVQDTEKPATPNDSKIPGRGKSDNSASSQKQSDDKQIPVEKKVESVPPAAATSSPATTDEPKKIDQEAHSKTASSPGKHDHKSAQKQEPSVDAKIESKVVEAKRESNPEPKVESKPESKPEQKAETKVESQPPEIIEEVEFGGNVNISKPSSEATEGPSVAGGLVGVDDGSKRDDGDFRANRQNNNRRGSGRPRGGRGGLRIPQGEFDFEQSNAKFDKAGVVAAISGSAAEAPTSIPSTAVATLPSEGKFYEKSSFFDNISCEAKERAEQKGDDHPGERRRNRIAEERKLNYETFGQATSGRGRGGRGGRGGGQGRGGYDGGQNGGGYRRYQGEGQDNQRGGFRRHQEGEQGSQRRWQGDQHSGERRQQREDGQSQTNGGGRGGHRGWRGGNGGGLRRGGYGQQQQPQVQAQGQAA